MSKHSQSSISFQCRIYKIEQRPTIWKCFLECFHDDECDYFVDVNSHCCYGDFQYNGTATTWTDDVTVYVKNGKQAFLLIYVDKILIKSGQVYCLHTQVCNTPDMI